MEAPSTHAGWVAARVWDAIMEASTDVGLMRLEQEHSHTRARRGSSALEAPVPLTSLIERLCESDRCAANRVQRVLRPAEVLAHQQAVSATSSTSPTAAGLASTSPTTPSPLLEIGSPPLSVSARNKAAHDIVRSALSVRHPKYGWTALHAAAALRLSNCCALLLRRGGRADAPDRSSLHWTPLHWACAHGDIETVVRMLVSISDSDSAGRAGQRQRKSGPKQGRSKLRSPAGSIASPLETLLDSAGTSPFQLLVEADSRAGRLAPSLLEQQFVPVVNETGSKASLDALEGDAETTPRSRETVLKLFSWGSAVNLALGHSVASVHDQIRRPKPVPSLETARATAVSDFHSLATTQQGELYAWGAAGSHGRLGIQSPDPVDSASVLKDALLPTRVFGLNYIRVVSVAAGNEHSACTSALGHCYTWGLGKWGALGHGEGSAAGQDQVVPRRVRGILDDVFVSSVACGDRHTVCLVEQLTAAQRASRGVSPVVDGRRADHSDTVVAGSSSGSDGDDDTLFALSPGSSISDRSENFANMLPRRNLPTRRVVTFGCADDGALGHGFAMRFNTMHNSRASSEAHTIQFHPRYVISADDLNVRQIAAGSKHTAFLGDAGRDVGDSFGAVYACGLGRGHVRRLRPASSFQFNIIAVCAGGDYTACSTSCGAALVWHGYEGGHRVEFADKSGKEAEASRDDDWTSFTEKSASVEHDKRSFVALVAVSRSFLCIATQDDVIHVFSSRGSRDLGSLPLNFGSLEHNTFKVGDGSPESIICSSLHLCVIAPLSIAKTPVDAERSDASRLRSLVRAVGSPEFSDLHILCKYGARVYAHAVVVASRCIPLRQALLAPRAGLSGSGPLEVSWSGDDRPGVCSIYLPALSEQSVIFLMHLVYEGSLVLIDQDRVPADEIYQVLLVAAAWGLLKPDFTDLTVGRERNRNGTSSRFLVDSDLSSFSNGFRWALSIEALARFSDIALIAGDCDDDCTSRASDEAIASYRIFLWTRSPFFAAALSSFSHFQWREQSDSNVSIGGVSGASLRKLAIFVCDPIVADLGSKSELAHANCDEHLELMMLGSQLMLPELQAFAEQQLVARMDVESIADVISAADACSSFNLLQACAQFVRSDLVQLFESNAMFDFSEGFIGSLSRSMCVIVCLNDVSDESAAAASDRRLRYALLHGVPHEANSVSVCEKKPPTARRRRRTKSIGGSTEPETPRIEPVQIETDTIISPTATNSCVPSTASGWSRVEQPSTDTSLREIMAAEERVKRQDWVHRASTGARATVVHSTPKKIETAARSVTPPRSMSQPVIPKRSSNASPKRGAHVHLRTSAKPWEHVFVSSPAADVAVQGRTSLRHIQFLEEEAARQARKMQADLRQASLMKIQEDELALQELRAMFGEDVDVPVDQAQLFLASALGWSS